MTRKGKENARETTDEQATKRQRIFVNPHIESSLPPHWSIAPSPPSTSAPRLVWPAYPCPVGSLASAATRYPYMYMLTEGDGYHFTDYSTLHARSLANPPSIMRSDGAASTQAPRSMGPPHPAAAAPGPMGPSAPYPYLFTGGAPYRHSTAPASTLPAYGWSSAPASTLPSAYGLSSAPRPMGPPAPRPRLIGPQATYGWSSAPASTLPAYGWSSAPCPRPMGPPAPRRRSRPMAPRAASAPRPRPIGPRAASAPRPHPMGPPSPRPMGPPVERVDEADERVDEDELDLELRL